LNLHAQNYGFGSHWKFYESGSCFNQYRSFCLRSLMLSSVSDEDMAMKLLVAGQATWEKRRKCYQVFMNLISCIDHSVLSAQRENTWERGYS